MTDKNVTTAKTKHDWCCLDCGHEFTAATPTGEFDWPGCPRCGGDRTSQKAPPPAAPRTEPCGGWNDAIADYVLHNIHQHERERIEVILRDFSRVLHPTTRGADLPSENK